MTRRAAIVSALRTPFGRYGGALSSVRPDDLAAHAIKYAVQQAGIDPASIDDVYLGAANQAGEDNRNVARMAALLAGLPISVGGCTVNRLCASGLEAINIAARMIEANCGDVFVAGGVESMSRAPFVMAKGERAFDRKLDVHDTTIGWRFTNPALSELHHPYGMGETAENLARKFKISRDEQDRFAVLSQQKWALANEMNIFDDELLAVDVPQRRKDPIHFDTDEHPRPNTTVETLAKLRPAFAQDDEATVTAGNSSGVNDGAAALVLMEAGRAKQEGRKILALVGPSASAGVDPATMGLGPVPATQKALARAGLTVEDIGLFELNEAFAAQSIACTRELGLDLDRVNVNGGAIAIGHPLGASGARLAATLVHEMNRRKTDLGVATLCVGVGQGLATVFEHP
ncbi:MAG: acetyl-CoA C-acyltransferase [Phycisphaerae bacterium]|jgi:3-oxoadipyl-CoA thiolase|nr:acetyl-CoA C-acyltransferase [Phycisphaerae bacterium]MBT5382792.1 acetyl-CoA C-acyltransferase [Phycisphaerae bacterium]MBT5583816.1 acetyl-CoA C-acyltransferase [Phycisphaerae bacterium]